MIPRTDLKGLIDYLDLEKRGKKKVKIQSSGEETRNMNRPMKVRKSMWIFIFHVIHTKMTKAVTFSKPFFLSHPSLGSGPQTSQLCEYWNQCMGAIINVLAFIG